MTHRHLLRLSAFLAILGGGARVLFAYIPWGPDSPRLEALYAFEDTAMLFGLMGIYLASADKTGWIGLIGFALAAAGLASIVGPDAVMFDIEFYQIGGTIAMMGLALLGIARLRNGVGPMAIALIWPIAFAVGILGTLTMNPLLGFIIPGILFGGGFVATGLHLIYAKQGTL
ncbi:MAG: hypothetical protein JKY60_05020 [Kordiimonadaceae bacterium]|nr:hypothetical protein [Kordiimonadaceae bacterium]